MTTPNLKRYAAQQTTDDALIWFLDIEAPGTTNIYACSNNVKTRANSKDYEPFPFAVSLMADDGERFTAVQVITANISRDFVDLVRQLPTAPTVKLHLGIVDSAGTASIEKVIDFLTLSNVSYDKSQITFTLAPSSVWGRKTSQATFSPSVFRALHYATR